MLYITAYSRVADERTTEHNLRDAVGTDGADTYGHSEIQLPVQLLNSTVRMHGEPQPPPSCSLQRTVTIRCYAVALKPLCLQHPLRNSWFRWIDH